jgi:hypothetical protein
MTDVPAPTPLRPPPPLLDGRDWLRIAALTVAGMGLRLWWFSGYGLGDDIVLRNFINMVVTQGNVLHDNLAYRVTWWVPTAITCRLWGLREIPYLLPILVSATCSFTVVYACGKALYGRPGALVAALLFIACPLDFAWATMLTPDLQASMFSALALFCVLRAGEQPLPFPRRRLLAWAALTSWLAFHCKVSCAAMAVPILFAFWRFRRVLGRDLWAFFLPASVLFGGTVAVSYAFTGDVFAPYSSEVSAQGLSGPVAVKFHALSEYVFWAYFRWLFKFNQYGDLFYSVYPHLLVGFALVGPVLRVKPRAPEVWVWMVTVFLLMQFNIQRAEGVWVAGFRNVRHTHVFVYPMILLVTGYLVAAIARWPRVIRAAVAALVVIGLWQSMRVAAKTQVSFEDRRRAAHFLATLPKKTVYSDFQINTWRAIIPGEEIRQPFKELPSFVADERRAVLAAAPEGYLVTGGGREPWYGCIDCIPREGEVSKEQWRVIKEFPEAGRPIAVWRPEPLRIWERIPPPSVAPAGPPLAAPHAGP